MDNTQQLLAETTRRVLTESGRAAVVPALRELGWFDLRAADPAAVTGMFFELQGETLATSGVLDAVLAQAADVPVEGTAVLHPLPGADVHPAVVDGLVCRPLTEVDRIVVPSADGVVLVAADAPLEVRPVQGLDPDLDWQRVRGTVPGEPVGSSSDTCIELARRAVGHELVGLARHLLAMGVEHAKQRHQFGRALGSFQAVQHRLAEARVALDVAEEALRAAWTVPEALATTMAKLLAGTAARTAAKQCQQVLGGMGFTWEHPMHRYLRRTLALDAFYGSTRSLCGQVGAELVETRSAPGLVLL